MRIRLSLTAAATYAAAGCVTASSLGAQASTYDLVVAATTDVHGRVRGWNYETNREDVTRGLSRAATIVDSVRRVPGVQAADGFLQGYAQFVEKDGSTTIQTAGAPTFGISWSGGDQVGPARIAQGRRPVRDGQVAMDVGTAKRHGFKVGDRVKVLLEGEAEEFKLVGLFKLGNQGDFGAVSFAAFDPQTAQRVFGAPGVFDAVNVRVKPGTPIPVAKKNLERLLGPSGFDITSAAVVADETRKPVDEFLNVLNDALLGFAGVGLLVGGFIIFNTFTILIAQRTRELGLLRAMGASGGQVVGSVLLEAVVMGLVASVAGFFLGIGLGKLLLWALPGFGVPVPARSLVVLDLRDLRWDWA